MNWSTIEQESRPQLVNRLVLHIRTKDKEAFESALQKGCAYFGEEKLVFILENDFVPKVKECSELETYIKWADEIK